jgi:ribosome-binding protein aMBF1 (putative translation factor)
MKNVIERIRPRMPQPDLTNIDLSLDKQEFREVVGDRFRTVRLNLGMTISTVADAIGVDNSNISRFESGTLGMDIHRIVLLTQVYGVSIQEMLRGEYDNAEES